MQRPIEERLVAYLDGEADEEEAAAIERALAGDPELAEKARRLGDNAMALRGAFDAVLHEPVPGRLIAAAHGIPSLGGARAGRRAARTGLGRWLGVPLAAALTGLVVGGALGWLSGNGHGTLVAEQQPATATAAAGGWLDNIAGYHKLFVNAGANDAELADVPAGDSANAARNVKLPADFKLPNLKPWGLVFEGARYLIIEGRPAIQLFYKTDNKALGPLTIVEGSTARPDIAATFEHRDDLNMMYWRSHGHALALVGTADIGYLWNIHNDLAWQLDAI